jgi:hypothetical protein
MHQAHIGGGLDMDVLPLDGWNGYFDLEDFAFNQAQNFI